MATRTRIQTTLRLLLRGLGALVLPGTMTLLYTQASGCGAPCTGPDRVFDQGDRWSVGSGTERELRWESSPPDGPFLAFEGNADYHFQHKLGARPYAWTIDLSFSDRPEIQGNGGSAPTAGNLALVLRTTEDEIVVKSDTCANYFIRIVVFARAPSAKDSGVDAPTDVFGDSSSDAATDSPSDAATD